MDATSPSLPKPSGNYIPSFRGRERYLW